MPRQPFSSFHREKKFYVIVSTKNENFGGKPHFATAGHGGSTNVLLAKRFYSKKAAEAVLSKGHFNPHMAFVVVRARETYKGIDIYT